MSQAQHLVIGLGELGSVFATGLLKLGHTVVPILRNQNLTEMAQDITTPASVWVCVAEKDIHNLLAEIPEAWRSQLILIQNELLPHDWQQHHIPNPTVISVWFEKKAGKLPQVVLPSVTYGALSELVIAVYNKLNLPIRQLVSEDALRFELVLKNLYIQTSNIAGLAVGGTTSELVEQHGHLMQAVANDVIALQEKLTNHHFDHTQLMEALKTAFYGDPNHSCMGRSAPARLQRALALAKQHNITLPSITAIAASH
ncbi:MAG: hypothetical protein JHC38_04990 [Thiotrichales bacterium]|nr:hypothetical protein [Thiotrichales bacterium]